MNTCTYNVSLSVIYRVAYHLLGSVPDIDPAPSYPYLHLVNITVARMIMKDSLP